jgi:hypothetical protein
MAVPESAHLRADLACAGYVLDVKYSAGISDASRAVGITFSPG